jgi:hypothetical protein
MQLFAILSSVVTVTVRLLSPDIAIPHVASDALER